MDCLVLGDSIAVGTARQLPSCTSYSVGGYNSQRWNQRFHDRPLTARNVIISLGTNDLKNVNTFDELQKIRQRVKADRVYWIMPPIKPAIQELVRRLAAEHGDVILPITQLSPDRVHPTPQGYRELAAKTKIKEQQ